MNFFSLFVAFALASARLALPTLPQAQPANGEAQRAFAEKISVPGIENVGRVSRHLFRGAQPEPGHLAELQKLGVTTILDLRKEARSTREREREEAARLGFGFLSLPVGGFSIPSSAELAQFFLLVRKVPPETLFVHCEFGADRTGIFIAAYRIAFDHWSPEEALAEMRAFHFSRFWHPSYVSFVRELPTRLGTDPVLRSALTGR